MTKLKNRSILPFVINYNNMKEVIEELLISIFIGMCISLSIIFYTDIQLIKTETLVDVNTFAIIPHDMLAGHKYKYWLPFQISAYSKQETCAHRICRTASGKIANEMTAACPRKYKLGTVIYIEGIGKRICEDRLSNQYDFRIDIWMGEKDGHARAKQHGLKARRVYFE